MPNPITIFDRRRLRRQRQRAAATLCETSFLLEEGAQRLAGRLEDMSKRFPMVLDLGAHDGTAAKHIRSLNGIEHIVHADLSQAMVARAGRLRVVADEEWLPFAPDSFDLCVSVFSLHWINDLPGALIQICRALKPGGLFIAMLPGGETLQQLRLSFEQAELAATGGMSPRLSPFLDPREGGSLLVRAGFELPVTDTELLTIQYEHPMRLIEDLRRGGESNALLARHKAPLRRSVLRGMVEYYRRHFTGASGRVDATLEIVTLTGQKPQAVQRHAPA